MTLECSSAEEYTAGFLDPKIFSNFGEESNFGLSMRGIIIFYCQIPPILRGFSPFARLAIRLSALSKNTVLKR